MQEVLLKNPYERLLKYAEDSYPHTGMKLFRYLALQPGSLVLPPLNYKGRDVRSTIHTLVLAKSGAAKSSISNILKELVQNPFEFKGTTAPFLREFLRGKNSVSMIIDDIAEVMKNSRTMKMVEGILEEQRVSDNPHS